jgi:hypothetical protein
VGAPRGVCWCGGAWLVEPARDCVWACAAVVCALDWLVVWERAVGVLDCVAGGGGGGDGGGRRLLLL